MLHITHTKEFDGGAKRTLTRSPRCRLSASHCQCAQDWHLAKMNPPASLTFFSVALEFPLLKGLGDSSGEMISYARRENCDQYRNERPKEHTVHQESSFK